jgi:quinol-cytochrome oxidoreductase complex cytochrome b subunit
MSNDSKLPLTASLFDLRSVIGILFAVYGIVLTILGIIGETAEELAKAGGIALNLWTGLAMLVGAVIFFVWVWRRPPLPPSREEVAEVEERPAGH